MGTVVSTGDSSALLSLITICATLPDNWHLVVIGDGVDRQAVLNEADRLQINHRVHLPGAITDLSQVLGLFDIFISASDTSRDTRILLKAMAAALPIVAVDAGDTAIMVSAENRAFIASPHAIQGDLERAVKTLASDKFLRTKLGEANLRKALSDFDEQANIATYKRLYASAMRRVGW